MRWGWWILVLVCTAGLRAEARAHLDAATQAVYDQVCDGEGWLLGCGELFAPAEPGGRFQPSYANQMQRWEELYGEARLPAVYEFEMGEANQRQATRDWDGLRDFSERGGLPWIQFSLNNFTVAWAGRQGRNVVGGMNDTRGGLAPILPGGAEHERYIAYLTTFARELKAAGQPVVLRFMHEMNGGWFWWGGQPARYQQVWREAFALFEAEGVQNVIWCWSPSADAGRLAAYYPGDDVVDILGTSNYFDDPALPPKIRAGLDELATLGGDKPIWLSELGPLARLDFWRDALTTFAGVDRLRGFNLWFARGWQAWGRDPERGSLIDERSSAELRDTFLAFVDSERVVTLAEWR